MLSWKLTMQASAWIGCRLPGGTNQATMFKGPGVPRNHGGLFMALQVRLPSNLCILANTIPDGNKFHIRIPRLIAHQWYPLHHDQPLQGVKTEVWLHEDCREEEYVSGVNS